MSLAAEEQGPCQGFDRAQPRENVRLTAEAIDLLQLLHPGRL